ncbi:MAG: peptidylprolyl isomerase [Clostridia bacterium]|nr:peptidylprolyl isomerase [Clostridia bacterium]
MKKIKFISILVILSLLCSCSLINNAYIAKVNDEQIKVAEYKYYLEVAKFSIMATAGTSADDSSFWSTTDINGKSAIDIVKETALDDAVKATIIAQQAKKEGITLKGSEVNTQIANAKKSELAVYLKQKGVTEEGLTLAFEKAYLRAKLFEKYKNNNTISVTDESINNFYNDNYLTVKHILFLTTDPSTSTVVRSDEEALLLANDTIAKIKSGENFDELAKTLSEDPGLASSPDGYTITDNGQMVAEFESAAFSLQVNEVSAPVKTSYGYHILKREPLIPFETFRQTNNISDIANAILADAEDKLVEEWKASTKIEKNESEYNKISIS